MKIRHVTVMLLLLSLTADAQPVEVTDASGETVVINSTERIIGLNGSITEILVALGLDANIVGCDASATYPREVVKTLPSVGYQYRLNAEGILYLRPTLVIGRQDVKPPQVVEQLRAAGVTVLLLREPRTFDEAEQRLRTIGTAVNRQERAEELISALAKHIESLESKLATREGQPKRKALFLYLRGPQTAFVLGKNSAAGAMIEIAGAANAAEKSKARSR